MLWGQVLQSRNCSAPEPYNNPIHACVGLQDLTLLAHAWVKCCGVRVLWGQVLQSRNRSAPEPYNNPIHAFVGLQDLTLIC